MGKTKAHQTRRMLVIPDAHFPDVDRRAWNTMLAAGEALKPDTVCIIGDFLDGYPISFHAKHPSKRRSLAAEIDSANRGLDEVMGIGAKRVIYCEGNHEHRLDRYIAEKCPELYGVVSDLSGLLKIHQRKGWEWHPYRTFVRVGKLVIAHDFGKAGANAMRDSLAAVGDNICFGHTHRLGTYYGGTIDGTTHVALNVGWLGNINAIDYRHRFEAAKNSQHGFGWVEFDERGTAFCQAIPIVNGRAIVNGKAVRG